MSDPTPSLVEFYRQHGISPVGQDISNLDTHFTRRAALYRHLGLLPGMFRGRSIIEIGPGSGYNSLFTATLAPSRYVLLEGNPKGVADIERLFGQHGLRDRIEIVSALLQEYDSADRFDFVICEGMLALAGVADPGVLLRSVGRLAAPGGVLLITTIDAMSDFAETLRRLFAHLLLDPASPLSAQSAALTPVFSPHLATLTGMSRPHEDWVIDNLLNPASIGPYLSIPDAIAGLGDGFELFGTSPRFMTDWRWYKTIVPGQTRYNEIAVDQVLAERPQSARPSPHLRAAGWRRQSPLLRALRGDAGSHPAVPSDPRRRRGGRDSRRCSRAGGGSRRVQRRHRGGARRGRVAAVNDARRHSRGREQEVRIVVRPRSAVFEFQFPPGMIKSRCAALIGLLGVSTLLVVDKCFSLGMHWYLSVRYWYYAIPSYFSEAYYGAPAYTYYRPVSAHLSTAQPFDDPSRFQAILDSARFGLPLADRTAHLFPADEKGTVDFVRVAFSLFGTHAESMFYLYLAVMAVSLTFFVIRFRKDADVLLLGVVGSAAFYVLVAALPVTKEVYSVTNPRAIGSLSFLPLLHLAVLTIRRVPISRWHVPELIWLSLVMAWVVSMRTSELWQTIALVACLLVAWLRPAAGSRRAWWPVAAVVAALAGQSAYQAAAYPSGYFTSNLSTKIFWHNVLIGMSLHPELARQYRLDVSDTSVFLYIKELASRDTTADPASIFWSASEQPDGMVKDFRAYDRLCRQTVLRIAASHPVETATLLLWYKPRQFVRSLQYAAGDVRHDLAYYSLVDQTGSLLTAGERLAKNAFFNPLSPLVLLIVTLAGVIAGAEVVRHAFDGTMLWALAAIAAASTIPGFITYPLIHVISGLYFTLTLVLCALAARAAVEIGRTPVTAGQAI